MPKLQEPYPITVEGELIEHISRTNKPGILSSTNYIIIQVLLTKYSKRKLDTDSQIDSIEGLRPFFASKAKA
jgi:hypothetical protein